MTSHGRTSEHSGEPWTDLTMAAASGLAWLSGYDDHTLPPMRGRGNQTLQIAGTHATMATLTALLHRDATGVGQHVDVSAFAACNVTTETRHLLLDSWRVRDGAASDRALRLADPHHAGAGARRGMAAM